MNKVILGDSFVLVSSIFSNPFYLAQNVPSHAHWRINKLIASHQKEKDHLHAKTMAGAQIQKMIVNAKLLVRHQKNNFPISAKVISQSKFLTENFCPHFRSKMIFSGCLSEQNRLFWNSCDFLTKNDVSGAINNILFSDILPSFDSCSSVFKNAKCKAKCPANTYARNKNNAGSSILTKCSCQGQNCLWAVGKTIKPDLFCISEYRWSFVTTPNRLSPWTIIPRLGHFWPHGNFWPPSFPNIGEIANDHS